MGFHPLILHVYLSCFTLLPLQDVDVIFGGIAELLELSIQLVDSLEECIEMAGEMEGARCPQAGFVFEELAEVGVWKCAFILYSQTDFVF